MAIKHTPVNYSADGCPLRMLSSSVALDRGEKVFLIQWRGRQEGYNKNTQRSKAKDGLMLSSKCRCKRRLKVAEMVELGVRRRFQFSFCYSCQAITATHPSSSHRSTHTSRDTRSDITPERLLPVLYLVSQCFLLILLVQSYGYLLSRYCRRQPMHLYTETALPHPG
jgi:hypothetical protein